jgi:hypothetical protein
MLKTKPGADNRKRWKTIREEAGFGAIEPAVVSRLLAVMADDKIDAVKKWHASLPTNQQFKWCSPAAIMKHCPIFSRPAARAGSYKAPRVTHAGLRGRAACRSAAGRATGARDQLAAMYAATALRAGLERTPWFARIWTRAIRIAR